MASKIWFNNIVLWIQIESSWYVRILKIWLTMKWSYHLPICRSQGHLWYKFSTSQRDKINLSISFQIKDIGEVNVILGIKIIRDDCWIKPSQSHYIEKVLNWFSMLDTTLIINPTEPSMKFTKHTGSSISQLEYSKVIKSFIYFMTCNRSYIAFEVGKLSRFKSNPNPHHWMLIRRVLRHFKGFMDYGITYSEEAPFWNVILMLFWLIMKRIAFQLVVGYLLRGRCHFTVLNKTKMYSWLAEFIDLASAANEAETLRILLFEIPLLPKPISPMAIHKNYTTALAKAYRRVYKGKYCYFSFRHILVQEFITNGVIILMRTLSSIWLIFSLKPWVEIQLNNRQLQSGYVN